MLSTRIHRAITRPISIIVLSCVALVYAASFSSGVYNEYVYDYEVQVANGPNGFKFKAKASLDILYAARQGPKAGGGTEAAIADTATTDSLLVRLRITNPIFLPSESAKPDENVDSRRPATGKPLSLEDLNTEHSLYANVITLANGTALVKEIFTHKEDVTTFKNIKRSILLNILPTTHHLVAPKHQRQPVDQDNLLEYISVRPLCTYEQDNSLDQPELFSPDSISQVNIVAKAQARSAATPAGATGPTTTGVATKPDGPIRLPLVFQSVEGHQNVTFRSRVFTQATSEVTSRFTLNLIDQFKSSAHERFDQAESMAGAIKLLLGSDRNHYRQDSINLERERRRCSTHHCQRSLRELFDDYQDQLQEGSMASVEAAVVYLRILERLRQAAGTGSKEIMAILKDARASGPPGVESSFLDILAAARTKDSIQAALKHLRLDKNRNLDVAERFLSVLSVAAKTAAKMHLKRTLQSPYYFTPTEPLAPSPGAKAESARLASLKFIAEEFLARFEQAPANKWASTKLRWSSLLTLATLVNANNQEQNFSAPNDKLNLRLENLLLDELKSCAPDNVDCRIVAIQAIGNLGRLGEKQFEVLREHVIKFGRRESNSAMRVLRDLLQSQAKDRPLERRFYEALEDFLLKIVYDTDKETTSRVLAAEMIVRFVPNSLVSQELLNKLPSFGNNELATMIYSRMQSLKPDSFAKHHENWYWKSCIINGTSTSFVKTMARTESLNASYGVNVELLDKGKILKESSFDLLLDTKQRTQDLFSLGIFARGMSSFVSSDSADDSKSGSGAHDSAESTTAGMSLKLMGGYLRPYVFFDSLPQLMGHYWKGTASQPTTAFNGNLLLIDHSEGFPLVSGFVVEQQMRGVLSIDVSGQIKISLWTRDSHSVVTTRASIIVQASQSVFTSFDNLFNAHLFSFGGQALIDFMADVYFLEMPAKTCLQVTQPEFSIRYNSRRHEQLGAGDRQVRRRIMRQNYKVGAKSYSLNSENNKMCSALADEL